MRCHLLSTSILTLALAAAGTACKNQSVTPPTVTTKKTGFPANGNQGKTGQDNAGQVPPGDANPGATAQDPANLPSYLLTQADAAAVGQLFQPYQPPNWQPDALTSAPAFESIRGTTEAFLRQALAIPGLQPGRQLKVYIIDNQDPNAFADAHQRVAIYTASIKIGQPPGLLAVLCHEMLHAARNHSMKFDEFFSSTPDVMQARQVTGSYAEAHYNEATGIYRHSVSDYRLARQSWDLVSPKIAAFQKRLESEADTFGGMICGQLGMPAAAYTANIIGFLRTSEAAANASAGLHLSSTSPADDMQDGEELQIPSADLMSFLFFISDHPSNEERSAQLQRLQGEIAKHQTNAPFAAQWNSIYAAAASGLTLADVVISPVVKLTTSKGRVVVYKREHEHFPRRPKPFH